MNPESESQAAPPESSAAIAPPPPEPAQTGNQNEQARSVAQTSAAAASAGGSREGLSSIAALRGFAEANSLSFDMPRARRVRKAGTVSRRPMRRLI